MFVVLIFENRWNEKRNDDNELDIVVVVSDVPT
jgi:hypothetical protein